MRRSAAFWLGLTLGWAGPAPAVPASPVVRIGLEVVVARGGAPLLGRRVGLVVNDASRTADGTHAIEALRGAGVVLKRLFAPEHGLSGRAAAGEAIVGGTDARSGLPLVSLYGNRTRPDPADLRDLDVLVFDLQDAGVRFYTYVSTLLLCREAVAEAGIELVVLDRPNPLGGERIDGPSADESVGRTLLSMAPGPLVHGLTAGEMVRYVNERAAQKARVTVVPLEGWRREMTWADTGRPWVPPSPNLRTAEAAAAYPGTCLLEGTDVSEGRGTESPFLLLGAPWLPAEALARAVAVPGFRLEPTRVTPRASSAAPEPKHEGLDLPAVRVHVTDAALAQPYRLGVALIHALRSHAGFRWRGDGSGFDRLVGTARLRAALDRRDGVDAILAADAPAIAAFRRERRSALLY